MVPVSESARTPGAQTGHAATPPSGPPSKRRGESPGATRPHWAARGGRAHRRGRPRAWGSEPARQAEGPPAGRCWAGRAAARRRTLHGTGLRAATVAGPARRARARLPVFSPGRNLRQKENDPLNLGRQPCGDEKPGRGRGRAAARRARALTTGMACPGQQQASEPGHARNGRATTKHGPAPAAVRCARRAARGLRRRRWPRLAALGALGHPGAPGRAPQGPCLTGWGRVCRRRHTRGSRAANETKATIHITVSS